MSRVEELELGVDLLKGIGCCWCTCEMSVGGGGYGLLTEKSIKKFEMFLMWSSNLYFADQCNIIIIF